MSATPPSIGELVSALDRVAPLVKAAGWDPVGLQFGDPGAAAANVAVCHEVTEAVLAAMAAQPVDLLVTYHPLLFRPTSRLISGTDAAGRAYRMIRDGVALAVVHTAYDVVADGAADALADALGLSDRSSFGVAWGADTVKVVTYVPADAADSVMNGMAAAGAGVIGNYTACSFRVAGTGTFFAGEGTSPVAGAPGSGNAEPETRVEMVAPASSVDRVVAALVAAHPYEEPAYDVYDVRANAGFVGRAGNLPRPLPLDEFARHVATVLDAECRIAGDRSAPVATVGAVPGSGGSFVSTASVDVVVTGDVRHHDARSALERGVAVVDPGHAATERPGVAKLYAAVARLVDGAIDLTGVDADPWQG